MIEGAYLPCFTGRELATANFTSPGYTSEKIGKPKPEKPFGSCSILVTKIFPGQLELLAIRTDMKTWGAKLLGSMTSLLLRSLWNLPTLLYKIAFNFQVVWTICHSVARWKWRCLNGISSWSTRKRQKRWGEPLLF